MIRGKITFQGAEGGAGRRCGSRPCHCPPPGLGWFSQLSVDHGSRRFCPQPWECQESPPKLQRLLCPKPPLPTPPPEASISSGLSGMRSLLAPPGPGRRLIPGRIHHSSQGKRACGGQGEDLPQPASLARMEGWTDGWIDG